MKCKRNVTLIDKSARTFRSLNSALNFQMKENAAQGIGIIVNKAKYFKFIVKAYCMKQECSSFLPPTSALSGEKRA